MLNTFKDGFNSTGPCRTPVSVRVTPPDYFGGEFVFILKWQAAGAVMQIDTKCSHLASPYGIGQQAREGFDKFMNEKSGLTLQMLQEAKKKAVAASIHIR